MPWGRFALGLLLIFVFQTTLVRFVALPIVDLFLLYVLLLGLAAPLHDARIAAWLVGLAQDLGSDSALGTHAFAWGLAAILLTKLRSLANVGPYWVRLAIAMLAAAPALLLLSIHAAYWHGAAVSSWTMELLLILLTSAVAAAAAAQLAPQSALRGRFLAARR